MSVVINNSGSFHGIHAPGATVEAMFSFSSPQVNSAVIVGASLYESGDVEDPVGLDVTAVRVGGETATLLGEEKIQFGDKFLVTVLALRTIQNTAPSNFKIEVFTTGVNGFTSALTWAVLNNAAMVSPYFRAVEAISDIGASISINSLSHGREHLFMSTFGTTTDDILFPLIGSHAIVVVVSNPTSKVSNILTRKLGGYGNEIIGVNISDPNNALSAIGAEILAFPDGTWVC